ncbi:hypothetical protein LbFV_ORF34 [Leptopilina boulardi filamentous virus]|uniref:Uncharacterized protein n=1 Tax=Leptopilina boulardi filamentous virus TaxID=552509 RepID=A0A1S5YD86_9VIRU|nr:hypothetical protein LbFV_ORF34 [Leptopilina boulardi filamentous virus]AQQ79954.1 hypothetical protein LbFV_ORF34 [Leptopilina boulardi filamentous virus]
MVNLSKTHISIYIYSVCVSFTKIYILFFSYIYKKRLVFLYILLILVLKISSTIYKVNYKINKEKNIFRYYY